MIRMDARRLAREMAARRASTELERKQARARQRRLARATRKIGRPCIAI